jgi:hypothetical protein
MSRCARSRRIDCLVRRRRFSSRLPPSVPFLFEPPPFPLSLSLSLTRSLSLALSLSRSLTRSRLGLAVCARAYVHVTSLRLTRRTPCTCVPACVRARARQVIYLTDGAYLTRAPIKKRRSPRLAFDKQIGKTALALWKIKELRLFLLPILAALFPLVRCKRYASTFILIRGNFKCATRLTEAN